MYTIRRNSKLGQETSLTTDGKKSDTFRPLDILANNHFMLLSNVGVDDGLDGSADWN